MSDTTQADNSEFGQRPALLAINMINGFTQQDSPLTQATSANIENTQRLLTAFRLSAMPIGFSSFVFQNHSEGQELSKKQPDLSLLSPNSEWINLDERLCRLPEDPLFEQSGPSSFFATSLTEWLVLNDADCLIIVGGSTSNSVRATVVDCVHHNYPVWVARDACFDSDLHAHETNLQDIQRLYASVKTSDEIIEYLARSSCVKEADYI